MQNPPPAPTASGSFVKTPFPHLLVYALERRLTGTFELSYGDAPTATMLVLNGCPAKVRTIEPIHFLGTVMSELGMISLEQLEKSLTRMQESPRLQGEILLELGAIDPSGLDAALRSQVERKVEHLFSLPVETTFAYYDELDVLQRFGGPPTPIDPFPVLWRGVRETPALEHVEATLRRIGGAWIRAAATAQFPRFAFTPEELQVVEILQQRAVSVSELMNALGPGPGQVLAYFLMIMKQVDLLDMQPQAPVQPAQTPVQPSAPVETEAAQAPMPTPAQPPVQAVPQPAPSQPSATGRHAAVVPGPPSSGQAFARLQLQRQPARSSPLVVEEHVAPPSEHDDRASSPGMQAARGAFGAPPAPSSTTSAFGRAPSPTDSSTEASATSAPAEPAPAAEDRGSARTLTAEQNVMKAKILARAEQITSQDYFQMLGLGRDAQPDVVQKTFIALAKVWHPDRLPPALVDVKDACSKVFTHITEAHATLTDASKREEYMMLLKDGGATPDDQAKIQAIIEAATEFQKAEFLLKRNPTDPKAYEIVTRCVSLDDQADYVATLAWLDAQKPEWQDREKTLEKISVLDRCIERSPRCERAFFYRGLLYKRAEDPMRALDDFKRASELNPRNLDAMREVRIFNMRQAASKPPSSMGGARASKPPSPSDKRGGSLFGKLFKK